MAKVHGIEDHSILGGWLIDEANIGEIADRITQEFTILEAESKKMRTPDHQMSFNIERDNFKSNMPYKHNHVKLDGDYDINASMISSPIDHSHPNDFIATQFP